MRVTLVHNPGAGDETQPDGEALQRMVRDAGHEVRYVSCAAGDWRSALDEPADLVAIAGGDGTVGRAAKALVGRGVAFTALPLGTANNIARSMGLAGVPVPALVAGWTKARRLSLDAGIAHGPWGVSHFIEGFGTGLFACTMPEADAHPTLESLDDAEAKIAYALQMLRDRLDACDAVRLRLALDGRDLSGEYLLVEAMNMPFVGPNLYLAPRCDVRDGMLDVVLVPASARQRFERHLADWQDGMLWPPDLPTYRGRCLTLDWTGFPVHVDDTVWPDSGPAPRPGTIEVIAQPGALTFLAPESQSAGGGDVSSSTSARNVLE